MFCMYRKEVTVMCELENREQGRSIRPSGSYGAKRSDSAPIGVARLDFLETTKRLN